jgi:hypothetical protein
MLKKIDDLKRKDKILVHTCCAPCLSAIHQLLEKNLSEVVLFYYNPNIHPYTEYLLRYNSLLAFTALKKMKGNLLHGSYDIKDYFRMINGTEEYPDRCRFCYRLRLQETAKKARELGIHIFTTTIFASPHQLKATALEEALRAAEVFDISVLDLEIIRDEYFDAVKAYRKTSLYYQNYCGCVFSNYEAMKERGVKLP